MNDWCADGANRLTTVKQKRDAPGWAHSSQKQKIKPRGLLWRGFLFWYNKRIGVVAHLVERSIRIAEVVGSSPIYSTRNYLNIKWQNKSQV